MEDLLLGKEDRALRVASVAVPAGRPISIALLGPAPELELVQECLERLGSVVRIAGIARVGASSIEVSKTAELDRVLAIKDLDLVVDLCNDNSVSSLVRKLAGETLVVSGGGAELVRRLFETLMALEKERKTFEELERSHQEYEITMEESRRRMSRANAELEARLAEIFFTHEFFKALTAHISVAEVADLLSDGVNGILGPGISCVYQLDSEARALILLAWHGRPKERFRDRIRLGIGIVGEAAIAGSMLQEERPARSRSFLKGENLMMHAAVPLHMQENTLGVLAIGASVERRLTPQEQERLESIANMGSLALQNAIFHEQLEWLSLTDRLTELYNYGYFHRRLEEEVRRAARSGEPVSLIMLDIDHFKEYNDVFGHPKGDVVLKKISAIVRQQTRDIDICARYGGEEFVAILPGAEKEEAAAVADRVRRKVAEYEFEGDEEIPKVNKTVSLGVSSFPIDGDSPSRLVEKADRALYSAKRKGRNRVEVAT